MGDSQILLGNYNAAESPSPLHLRLSPPNFRAPVTLILFCMKASVLIYDFFLFFFFVQCVCLETPVVVKLPWLSLKLRLNEIWMWREWIRVMEWAKYCLRGVCAILSWGDRYSGLRKVKPLSKFSEFISRPEKFASMQCWWLLCFKVSRCKRIKTETVKISLPFYL